MAIKREHCHCLHAHTCRLQRLPTRLWGEGRWTAGNGPMRTIHRHDDAPLAAQESVAVEQVAHRRCRRALATAWDAGDPKSGRDLFSRHAGAAALAARCSKISS